MATRKAKSQRKPGVLIDVARFISASQDRSTALLLASGLAALGGGKFKEAVGPRGTGA